MEFWVASGYTAVSAGTKRFLHRLRVVSSITLIESEPHEPVSNFFDLNALVAHRLKPYEDHADQLLARKALPTKVKDHRPGPETLARSSGHGLRRPWALTHSCSVGAAVAHRHTRASSRVAAAMAPPSTSAFLIGA
jgi:hypothetical protein